MKKITLLLLFLGAVSLYSCDVNTKNGGSNEESMRLYYGNLMAAAASTQIIFEMDPFNLAFRLNTLMTECENAGLEITDVNNPAVESVRASLFGKNTVITYEDSNGAFTLRLGSGAAYDYSRSGTMLIFTDGALLKDGVSWTLGMDEPYTLISSSGYSIDQWISGSYRILAPHETENTWSISISGMITKTNNLEENRNVTWSGSIKIIQDEYPRDQSLAKVSASTYSCVVNSDPGVGAIDIPDDKYTMTTLDGKPLRFSPNCDQNRIVGGELMIFLSEHIAEYPTAYTLCSWGDKVDCNAEGSARYYGPL